MHGKITALFQLVGRLRAFSTDTRGATAIEYGLIVALISIAIVAAITTLSGNMKTVYSTIANALK